MTSEPFKRFLLFRYWSYYPEGALNDIAGDYDSLDDALRAYKEFGYADFAEILDLQERRIVWEQE